MRHCLHAVEHGEQVLGRELRAAAALGEPLRGLAVVNAIERAAGPAPEFAEIRFAPSGSATIFMGTKNQGQGHETTFKQILHERLGIDPAEVRYIDGDTDRVAFGMGTMGSRSTVIGGTALWTAADKVIAKGRKIAARQLEAAEADIVFASGKFAVTGTDRAVTLKEVARAAFQPAQLPAGLEPGLYETGTFAPKQDTWPNGCHVCEVEVDQDTGAVTLASYVIVDDVGTVINPLTLKGQIHGGVAQGVGQALMEQVVYEPESGQLLTASFMEYAMPRADSFCDVRIESSPVPTKLNPLGAKGAGEAGTVGALPVVVNAVMGAEVNAIRLWQRRARRFLWLLVLPVMLALIHPLRHAAHEDGDVLLTGIEPSQQGPVGFKRSHTAIDPAEGEVLPELVEDPAGQHDPALRSLRPLQVTGVLVSPRAVDDACDLPTAAQQNSFSRPVTVLACVQLDEVGAVVTATATVTGAGGLSQSVAVVYTGDCTNVTTPDGCTATSGISKNGKRRLASAFQNGSNKRK